jgi:predicted ribosome quality control (RQC) complex YloA/Tae2 family protein
MGKDKFENENLIKFGWPEDVWFHVDKLSSAHVYLRLPPDVDWTNIPEDLLVDCAQLCKANSIEGNKKDNVTILYTPWYNLKKTQGMETGQVTFHKDTLVKKIHVATRQNHIINRLMKTRVEKYPDLNAERVERLRLDRDAERIMAKKQVLYQIWILR